MSLPPISESKKRLIREIFETMSYGEVSENDNLAKDWLKKNEKHLGSFINGSFVENNKSEKECEIVKNPCNGEILASIPVVSKDLFATAFATSSAAFSPWHTLSGHKRAQYLYNIARNIHKHLQLFAVLESIDSGKNVDKTKTQDVPNMIRSFYHNAGWAELWESEMSDWKPIGVVCVLTEEYNNPLMCLSWRVSSALASGNTVVLMPSISCCLSSLLFAEICSTSGLPPGVLNVVPFQNTTDISFGPQISKVIFTGSLEQSQELREIAAKCQTDLDVHSFGRPSALVFEGADLHSAAEGVLEKLYFNDTRCQSGGCRLLLQDSIKEAFLSILETRFRKLTLGTNMTKTDIIGIVTDAQANKLKLYINETQKQGAEVICLAADSKNLMTSYPPTLVSNVQTSSKLVFEEVGGPIISVIPFRTAKEAIMICNHNKNGSDVSVWSEKLTAALEIAHNLKAGTVWVNCQNQVDAAAGYGGVYKSGNAREGAKSGLYHFVKPKWMDVEKKKLTTNFKDFGESTNSNIEVKPVKAEGNKLMDHTFKLYYGGVQKRPDSNTSRTVFNNEDQVICQVPDGSRKDIRNAVECALAAQSKWQNKTGHNRAQILYYLAENLDLRKKEFAYDLHVITGRPKAACYDEVDSSVERLFYWAAYCDKYGGTIQETQMYGKVLESNEPLGVVGIICPDEYPLLSFISLLAAAISRGNTVVIVPSEKYPVSALKMCQVFETSDVPGGVINVVTGSANHLTRNLAFHMDVEAIWLHRNTDEGHAFVRSSANTNQKRVWVDCGRDWFNKDQGQGMEFLLHATYSKTIWLPMGDIFAN